MTPNWLSQFEWDLAVGLFQLVFCCSMDQCHTFFHQLLYDISYLANFLSVDDFLRLSTLQRYCPDGRVPNAIADGSNIWELIEKNGDDVDNEHWAPVGEEQNSWIQVGWREGQTCKTYKQLSREDPSWGITGIDSFAVTGYMMCCLDPSKSTDSSASVEATTTMSKDTAKATGLVKDAIARVFDPILYDRNRGWKGSTYDEAVQFCSDKEPTRVPCPVEV